MHILFEKHLLSLSIRLCQYYSLFSGDGMLDVLAACCLPQKVGSPQQMTNKSWIEVR